MTILHMDVETMQTTQAKILKQKDALLINLTSLKNQLEITIGSDWIGNSANEYLEYYNQTHTVFVKLLDELENLAQSLQSEIQQWIDMAARLG